MKIKRKRACDDCTLCCKLIGVEELDKDPGVQCQYVQIGPVKTGCSIYKNRPAMCRDFKCFWLQGLTPLNLKPNLINAVIVTTIDGERIVVHVEPEPPDYWKQNTDLREWIETVRQKNIDVIIAPTGRNRIFLPGVKNAKKMYDTGKLEL